MKRLALDPKLCSLFFGITLSCVGCGDSDEVGRQMSDDDADSGQAEPRADEGEHVDAAAGADDADDARDDLDGTATDDPDGVGSDDADTDDTASEDNGADPSESDAASNADRTDNDVENSTETGEDDSANDAVADDATTDDSVDTETATADAAATDDTTQPPDGECTIAGQRVLRVAATFRDFSDLHPDFGELCSGELMTGAVMPLLDAEGRPVASDLSYACIDSAESFAEWYRDTSQSVPLPAELVLFDDGAGGFVNRFGAQGEQFSATETGTEMGASSDDPTCTDNCANYASYSAPCAEACADLELQLAQAEAAYAEASESADAGAGAAEEHAALVAMLTAQLAACNTTCDVEKATLAEQCRTTCKPCSYSPELYCMYGTRVSFDGDPLFFPVDEVMGFTRDPSEAKLPDSFGYPSWPWEHEVLGQAVLHNFYFTTEVQIPFVFSAGLEAEVEFLGDDDAWVFINGHLAIDLGGLHTPTAGIATIDATTAAQYALVEGQSYQISVFHAERQMEGSSFLLALRGFSDLGEGDCGP